MASGTPCRARCERAVVLLVVAALWGCGHAAAGAQSLALSAPGFFAAAVEARSLAVGRARPGAPSELWLAHERGVLGITADGVGRPLWTPPRFARLLRLEASDLDGDGADEWVVTLEGVRVRSLVLGWRDGAFVELAPGRPGWLRPVLGPEGSTILLGQSVGADEPFTGPIRRVELRGGKLVDAEPLALPASLPLHDLFWIPPGPDYPARLFSLEESGHLAERDARSPRALLWRADVRTVARPVTSTRPYSNLLGEDVETTVDLPVPPVLVRRDDGWEVLLACGVTNPVPVLENVRVLQGGDARAMTPAARGLVERVRSPLLGRAMIGLVPFSQDEGSTLWAAAVWTRRDGGFVRPETRIYLLDATTGDLLPGPP